MLSEVRAARGALSPDGSSKLSESPKYGDDCRIIQQSLQSGGPFEGYKAKFSLDVKRHNGTALLWREAGPRPLKIRYTLPSSLPWADGDGGGEVQCLCPDSAAGVQAGLDDEGRVILSEWEGFYILTIYVPNNGKSPRSYARRLYFDARLREWLRDVALPADKPLLYLGDLNVAPTDLDLSHPHFMKHGQPRFVAKGTAEVPPDPGNTGQPGCTPHERFRFNLMLAKGGLVDAYRALTGDVEINTEVGASGYNLSSPLLSWRGSKGESGVGLFWKKGMRIDHALVSARMLPCVESVRIMAQGEGSEDASFMGSDHAPLLVKVNVEALEAVGSAAGAAAGASAGAAVAVVG